MLLENRYQILRALGQGGFGETFLAEDTHLPSGRHCVIKQLKPVNNDPKIYQVIKDRFQREAVMLEELGAANKQIPGLYAYFESDSQFYLVQEYIEGTTLSAHLQTKGTLSESSLREILVNLLPILDYIHSKRIIHRDIKPDNIILRNGDRLPVLIDFGAVKEAMGTLVSPSGHANSSIVIGTPGFMPSEQTAGRPVFSSDLYSLSLTAIYGLTGKTPQDLESDPQTGELIWRKYAPTVSPSLADILDKALQFHPRDRYNNASEMLAALQGNSQFPSTVVPPPKPPGNFTLTEASMPPSSGGYPQQPPTVVSTSPPYYSSPPTNQPRGLGEWQKAVITGGVVGLFILAASVIAVPMFKQEQETASKTTESPVETVVEEERTTQPNPKSIDDSKTSPEESNQVDLTTLEDSQSRSLGWIRIGAVNNNSGYVSVGDNLVSTTQPVTISPPSVPDVGSQVITSSGVNLRRNFPQPPNYKLFDKVGTFIPGQEVVILRLETFVDTTVSSEYTVVWAEVSLP